MEAEDFEAFHRFLDAGLKVDQIIFGRDSLEQDFEFSEFCGILRRKDINVRCIVFCTQPRKPEVVRQVIDALCEMKSLKQFFILPALPNFARTVEESLAERRPDVNFVREKKMTFTLTAPLDGSSP